MARIVVHAFISLDGVIQAGGGPDEDTEGGFPYGGWSMNFDAKYGQDDDPSIVPDWESKTDALLLGRKTYDIWSQAWAVWDENAEGFIGELTRRYNRVPKYIASRTLTELAWKNSELLGEDVPAAVAKLREERDGEIRIWGSSELVRSLSEYNLIDEYRIMVYPLVLGQGKRLFGDGFAFTRFELAESRALASGIVYNRYLRTEPDAATD